MPTAARAYNAKRYHYQGIGRYEPEGVYERGLADLEALAGLLGAGPFLFGDRPHGADAGCCGFLANIHFTGSRRRSGRSSVCPERGEGVALVLPEVSTAAMGVFLAELSRTVPAGTHAALVLDGAGWHVSDDLAVPANLTLIHPPPYNSPELNLVEWVWEYLRDPLAEPPRARRRLRGGGGRRLHGLERAPCRARAAALAHQLSVAPFSGQH